MLPSRRGRTASVASTLAVADTDDLAPGERRVCSLVCALSPEEEDRRRVTRERGTPPKGRIKHANRITDLLSGKGIRDYNPLRRDPFERLKALRTGEGRELPPLLKAKYVTHVRELDRIANLGKPAADGVTAQSGSWPRYSRRPRPADRDGGGTRRNRHVPRSPLNRRTPRLTRRWRRPAAVRQLAHSITRNVERRCPFARQSLLLETAHLVR